MSSICSALSMRLIERQSQAKLAQIGFHHAGHVGVLQLAGDVPPIGHAGAVHLAQAGGGGGLATEFGEAAVPNPAPSSLAHAPAHERPSPWAARWPAIAPVRRRIPAAARPEWWRGTAPPSSAGLSARRGSALRSSAWPALPAFGAEHALAGEGAPQCRPPHPTCGPSGGFRRTGFGLSTPAMPGWRDAVRHALAPAASRLLGSPLPARR